MSGPLTESNRLYLPALPKMVEAESPVRGLLLLSKVSSLLATDVIVPTVSSLAVVIPAASAYALSRADAC